MEEYKTVKNSACEEYVEKRSKFIGSCIPAETEQQAIDFINEQRSKYWDATHNVYAYIIKDTGVMRYSDDGEPQGTAGIPVLEVLKKNQITNAAIVVTRYFGGILLGAGGLVRAYSHSAKIALEKSQIITMKPKCLCELYCSYNQYGRISLAISSLGGNLDKLDFRDSIKINFHISEENLIILNKQISDLTCGKVSVKSTEMKFFCE